jgi:hypothetical protein
MMLRKIILPKYARIFSYIFLKPLPSLAAWSGLTGSVFEIYRALPCSIPEMEEVDKKSPQLS